MAHEQPVDTKQKILEAARVLFADKGFEGTSVREIARLASVNLASVNYHFTNKEKLLTEILSYGYHKVSQELRAYYETNDPGLEDTLIALFRFFLNQSHDLVGIFKIMMSSKYSRCLVSAGSEDEAFGPPGSAVLAAAIRKEVAGPILEEDLHWALRSLFTHVVHISIMYHCCFKNDPPPFTGVSDLEKNVRRLTRVVLRELQASEHSPVNLPSFDRD